MTTYKHIVQVHPVENGVPNLYKVKDEKEFETEQEAKNFADWMNQGYQAYGKQFKAVYHGWVNDATGELK